MFDDWNDAEFAAYLMRVAADFRESGMDATAEDYEEAARRLDPRSELQHDLFNTVEVK